MLGKIEGRRRRGQKTRCLDCITNSTDMSLTKLGSWWWMGKPGVLQSMEWQSRTGLSDWTELKRKPKLIKKEDTNLSRGKVYFIESMWKKTLCTIDSDNEVEITRQSVENSETSGLFISKHPPPLPWISGMCLWSDQDPGKWKSLSPVGLFVTPWTIPSMEFSRPEYCSGLPVPFFREPSQPRDWNPGLPHCRSILY